MATSNDPEKQPLLDSQREPETEPSLSQLQDNVRKAQRAYWRAWSTTTSGRWHRWIMISVSLLLTMFMISCMAVIVQDSLDDENDGWPYSEKVPLEVHIMSKCPDAKDCLHDMILPTMQNVSDKVDFKLSYIGTVTNEDDGVKCMHGPEECLGNIIELCAAYLYPSPKTYLGFTMCMTQHFEDVPERELVEDCALEHSISMEKLNDCIDRDDGEFGKNLLQASFNRTTDAEVSKSCTVRLNGETRCIRDGGEWTDCDGGYEVADLVADILELSDNSWN